MNILHKWIFLFGFCLGLVSNAQSKYTLIKGTVHAKNRFLKKVLVSNGDTIVQTDKKGRFEIPVKKGQVVFPIIPTNYTHSNAKKWWYHSLEDINKEPVFTLKKVKTKKEFKFLAIGDVQVGDDKELLYATKSVLTELLNRNDYDFSLYLGDLVNDAPELFVPLKKLIEDIPKPSWVVYGNHDRNFNAEQNQQFDFFRKHFGPETYAFFKNDILFVSLNSITHAGKYGYKNQYPPNQIRFLSQLLQQIPKDQQVIISQHVPFVAMKNKEELIKLLNPFKKVLFLSGHTHTVFQNEIIMPSGHVIHELTAGAASGNWWTGQKKWEGIPLSLMSCGTPRGYFEINFKNKDYKIQYKGINLPASKQFSYWVGDYNSEPISVLDKTNNIYINVFSGSYKTKVSLKLTDNTAISMTKERLVDPYINYIKKSQKENKSPDKNSKASPYLRTKSNHIWKGTFPKLNKGYHKVDILIEDPYFSSIKESIWVFKK
ncbi:calcineurin-like phosphoesterase C-terminal domain-containing protein [Wenyingzhuangia sp. 1_MG-2023]|nr:calcineurin-like phosphoesterase C-terminal domain-containing protein [Wenyingzhuangia sp. 1_MG-2023]